MAIRNAVVSLAVSVLALTLLPQGVAFAQVTSELLVPETKLQLACAEATENGKINIVRSRFTHKVVTIEEESGANSKSDGDGQERVDDNDDEKNDDANDGGEDKSKPRTVIENVTQTYTVKVPYTEQVEVDGKKVNVGKFRTEQRTRQVAVIRVVGQTGKGKMRAVQYKLAVPYTLEILKDGVPTRVTRERTEMHTEMIFENQKLVAVASPSVKTYEADKLKYFRLDGSQLSTEDARELLRERRPVVLVGNDGKIDPYFQHLVRPDTVLIHEGLKKK